MYRSARLLARSRNIVSKMEGAVISCPPQVLYHQIVMAFNAVSGKGALKNEDTTVSNLSSSNAYS